MFGSLVIGWFLSFGYVPQQADCVNTSVVSISPRDIATVAEIGLSAEFAPFKIYGSIENYQMFSGKTTFYPYRADYKAGIEITLAKGVSLIAEHECDHPVVFNTIGDSRYEYISSVTKIVVKFQGETR